MRNTLAIILLSLCCHSISGQTVQKVEQELLTAFKKIQPSSDSLTAANNHFSELLLDYTSKLPATLRTEFRYLVQEGLYVATSVDGLFRIYSWDTRQGGTGPQFESVYQYKIGNKLYSEKVVKGESEIGNYFSSVYTLKQDEKVWYLGLVHARHSSSEWYQGIKLFALDGQGLSKNVKLFRTASGLQDEIGFTFNLAKVSETMEKDNRLIYFDEADKKLHMPVVLADGKVTKRFNVYWFNGEYFEKLRD